MGTNTNRTVPEVGPELNGQFQLRNRTLTRAGFDEISAKYGPLLHQLTLRSCTSIHEHFFLLARSVTPVRTCTFTKHQCSMPQPHCLYDGRLVQSRTSIA